MTNEEKIITLFNEGRLLRKRWTGRDEYGRDTACLLAALSPEAGESGKAASCPADIMPTWLAHLTPWFDDKGTLAAWPAMVKRYANLAGRWHVLTQEDWRLLNYTARRICVEAALPFAENNKEVCQKVIDLLVASENGAIFKRSTWMQAARDAFKVADRTIQGDGVSFSAYSAGSAAQVEDGRGSRNYPGYAADAAGAFANKAASKKSLYAQREAVDKAAAEAADKITIDILSAIEFKIIYREAEANLQA